MTEKARITTIQFGAIPIEGIMLPNSVTPNNATRQVKALACKDSPLLQIKSNVNNKALACKDSRYPKSRY